MGQYLAWNIPRTRRFKMIQIKVPGVINGHVLRGHSFILGKTNHVKMRENNNDCYM